MAACWTRRLLPSPFLIRTKLRKMSSVSALPLRRSPRIAERAAKAVSAPPVTVNTTPSKARGEFSARVRELMRTTYKVVCVETLVFANSLLKKKGSDEWTDEDILAALNEWMSRGPCRAPCPCPCSRPGITATEYEATEAAYEAAKAAHEKADKDYKAACDEVRPAYWDHLHRRLGTYEYCVIKSRFNTASCRLNAASSAYDYAIKAWNRVRHEVLP